MGLWRFPLSRNSTAQELKTTIPQQSNSINHIQPQINSAYDYTTHPALVKFLHATAFSPVKLTWIQAIKKGFFHSWPGLTTQAINKHFPKSNATTKGHMDQTRQNIRTRQPRANKPDPTTEQDTVEPQQEPNNASTQQMFATITETGKIYTDQTGRFPVTSSRGNRYILVLYDYHTNAILTEPLKNCTGRNTQGIHKITCLLDKKGFSAPNTLAGQ
jgi:hypothetical protein